MRHRKTKDVKGETEVPPNSKIRIVATIDEKLKQEMERIHETELQDAKDHDRTEPDWSNTVEMLLRKGVKVYKSKGESETKSRSVT